MNIARTNTTQSPSRFRDDLQELFPLQQIVSPLHLDTLYDCGSGHVNIQPEDLPIYITLGKNEYSNVKLIITLFSFVTSNNINNNNNYNDI